MSSYNFISWSIQVLRWVYNYHDQNTKNLRSFLYLEHRCNKKTLGAFRTMEHFSHYSVLRWGRSTLKDKFSLSCNDSSIILRYVLNISMHLKKTANVW